VAAAIRKRERRMSSWQHSPLENWEASPIGARYTDTGRPVVLLVVVVNPVLPTTGAPAGTKTDLTVGAETTMSVLTMYPM